MSRVVVANGGGVVFDEEPHRQVDQQAVAWGPLPDLAGWVQLADRNVRFAVALVDHAGAPTTVVTLRVSRRCGRP